MTKEKSGLPFEVMGDKESRIGKKRIEIFVRPERSDAVISVIRSMNLAATMYESKGI